MVPYGNTGLSDGTKPLPESILFYHYYDIRELEVLWHSPMSNFTEIVQPTPLYNELKNIILLKFMLTHLLGAELS